MIDERPRWRSKAVNLVVLGTAGSLGTLLSGCSSDSGTYHRNIYKNYADCVFDYGGSVCSTEVLNNSQKVLGPAYRMVNGRPSSCNGQDPGAGPSWNSRRVSVEPARGGFGCRRSTSSSSSSGRSFFRGG